MYIHLGREGGGVCQAGALLERKRSSHCGKGRLINNNNNNTHRVDQLEKQQLVNMERFKTRAKELKSTATKELEEATLDSASLRRLIQIKNKELRRMKALASTILNQRTKMEQFFLESLQEVRDVIRRERLATKKRVDDIDLDVNSMVFQSHHRRNSFLNQEHIPS